jgi:cysteine sulfinate desulfinase/cysteine desulfurase-like protein
MGQGEGSYVVKALGGLNWKINNTIRVSVGRYTTKNDCENFISTLRKIKKDFF